MRVAYVLEQCWNPVPGGTALAAIEVARHLSEQSDVEVLGVSATHRRPAPAAFTPPVPMNRLPLPRLALYESWHKLRRPGVERATGPVDVIHATGLAIPPRTAPLVVTLHDLAWVHEPGQFSAKGRRFFAQALALINDFADLVLCSSEATATDAEANGLATDRLRVVPLGATPADQRATAEGIDEVKKRHGLSRPYILWVGTIEPRKNLPRLLEAYRRLAERQRRADGEAVDLVLVGPDGWNESIDAQLDQLGDRVHRLGFVSAADRNALYTGAEIFVLPSIREGFGLPVLEAMAHGTAVVTSAGTSTEEIVGAAGVVVDPLDVNALATAMGDLLADDVRRRALASAGVARAEHFTWRETAAATRRAYGEVA